MNVLIGIPTHKRPRLLRECLESIAQANQAPAISVFVADNDPVRSEGVEIVREMAGSYRFPLSARVVEEPGISAVRNAILAEGKRSGADFIAMIDDDETASPEWLAGLMKVQETTGAQAVGGPVQHVFGSPPKPSVVNSRMFRRPARSNGATSPLSATSNFLVSTRALVESDWPLFDSEFGLTGGEDGEWFFRLSRLGFRFAWAAEALVHEKVSPERTATRWILRRAYRCGNSDMRIWLKHQAWLKTVFNLAKSIAVLAFAPLMAPVLALPNWRLWLLTKWCRAAGKITALFGMDYEEYAGRHDGHGKAH